jgi:hypothetical protein
MAGFVARHRTALASTAVLAVAASSLVTYAFLAQGYETRSVDLNDGGIWVTSDRDGLFGRLNKPAGALDAALNPPGPAQSSYVLDIVQNGSAVAGWNRSTGELLPIDVATGKALADAKVAVSSTSQLASGGGTIAVLDPASGKVWAVRADASQSLTSLSGLDSSTKPLATVNSAGLDIGAASLAVGVDGAVHVALASGSALRLMPSAATGGFEPPETQNIGNGWAAVQASAIGGQLVVLDAERGKVRLPNGSIASFAADPLARVAQPAAGGSAVIIATSAQLLSVPPGGGDVSVLYAGATGAPAQPTWLAQCVHAAWAGSAGVYVRSCDGAVAQRGSLQDLSQLNSPRFRVNRNAIVLNDMASGALWDLTDQKKVDNWTAVKPPPVALSGDTTASTNPAVSTVDQPPAAADDTFGARPGRTTVLHVLDNDSDPQGYILSVASVTAPDNAAATLSIAPDGQTVQIAMPSGAGDVHFSYTVDDGKGLTATAAVTVSPRPAGLNEPPTLRRKAIEPVWTVSAGGRLSLPVLANWRDFDGDPVILTSATASVGSVSTSPDGRVEFIAGGSAAQVTLDYAVSDGVAATNASTAVTVLGPTSTQSSPPVAQPDVARGQVDRPITIHPLDNDLPGADPQSADPILTIAGSIASPAGATVTTDVASGTVTVTAARAGVYLLGYSLAYGNAPFGAGAIRVDVVDVPPSALPPVAMPDTAVMYGQNPVVVDVLANDFDPAGAVLVVQHAEALDLASPVQVAILQGHWLRISATSSRIASTPYVLRYTLADGVGANATGEVTVTQLPAPASDTPITRDDTAIVRAGDSVAIPVLDNDSAPAGSVLSLAPTVAGAPSAGQLTVSTASGQAGDIGSAYIAGNLVRFIAPAAVTAATSVRVEYVAQNALGEQATGHVTVRITPAPSVTNPDRPPAPQPIEARVVSGDSVRIAVPVSGVDPDGDSVSLTGIASPTNLGRVTGLSATTITYQAYPSSTVGGTDSFTYRVTDRYGKTAQSTVRVAVIQPGDPQAPVAVDDVVTVAPGVKLTADVLANDLRSPGDTATIVPLASTNPDLAGGAALKSDTGPITLTSPPADGKPLVILYGVTNGLGAPSIGKLTVRSIAGYNNPPTVPDVFAVPTSGSTSLEVDALARANDSDGDPSKLVIDSVALAGATINGSKVTLPLGEHPQSVAYVVRDSAGATAAAVIYLPGTGAGAPVAREGKTITVDRNGTVTVDINDYVLDPGGKPLILTITDRIWASPVADLRVASGGAAKLTLTGLNDYVGPAAVTFEVTDGTSINDPSGTSSVVTVPVQVGPETPVLRCPTSQLTVIAGGNDVKMDLTSLCHVWVADPTTVSSLAYTVSWTSSIAAVTIQESGSHVPSLRASGGAVPGASGTLAVSVVGSADATTGSLPAIVAAAPPPTIAPITIDGFKATDTATLDVAGYVTSQLRDAAISVVSITRTDGADATATSSGSTVTIKPGADSHGPIGFQVVATDVTDTSRADRQVIGRILLNVLNVPDAPTGLSADPTLFSHQAQLSWGAPAANGAPIDYYEVTWVGGSQQCSASPCAITGLTNGQTYTFSIRAHNLVGFSTPSAGTASAKPDAVPDAVTGLATSAPLDGTLTLTWAAAHVDGSPVEKYTIAWGNGGAQTVDGNTLSARPAGLDNHVRFTFSVTPWNAAGKGTAVDVQGSSSGKPGTPAQPTFVNANAAGNSSRTMTISWVAVDSNDPGPAAYSVGRDGVALGQCTEITATNCVDSGIENNGASHTYSVTAFNAAAAANPGPHTSDSSPALSVEAAATPDLNSNLSASPTGSNGQATLTYNVGASHGSISRTECQATASTCGPWANASTAAASGLTQTIGGLVNGSNTTISLRTCNGSAGGAQAGQSCSAWVTTNVTTYGPLGNPSVSANASGPSVNWTVSVDPNGKSATVQISNNHGRSQSYTTGNGPWSTSGSDPVGYSTNDTITVTVSDSGRGTTTGSGAADTPPPPPTVTATGKGNQVVVSKGASACTSAPGCSALNFRVDNFPSGTFSYTCIGNGSDYYTGSINITGPSEAFVDKGICVNNIHEPMAIRIDGVTSNTIQF